jgi:hypothetical protein
MKSAWTRSRSCHGNASRFKEMIEARHGKVVGVSEQTVQGRIDSAKAHE